MPSRANLDLIGIQPIDAGALIDSTKRGISGEIITVADAYWGGGEFMYVLFNSTVPVLGLVTLTPVFNSTTGQWDTVAVAVPNTANLGKTLGVAVNATVSGNYGWVCVGGLIPVSCNASVAADTAWGIAAAGQGGAITAGKQVLNSRIAAPATTTVAKANSFAQSGSLTLQVTNSEGWFVGAYLSGTGVAAGATVASISPDGRTVQMSAVSTAQITGTVTATYNNGTIFYNVASLNRPFAQGQIT